MKRKTLDDFYKPLKIVKIQDSCIDGSKDIKGRQSSAKGKDAFQVIMATSQKSQNFNLHLEYQQIENRHKWTYSFTTVHSAVFQSKSHKLKLNSNDPNEIILTFSTNHQGSKVHYFNLSKIPSFSPSLLKSILQKAVRRQNLNSSLMTSLQLAVNIG
jgi:hypothetical protein